MKNIVLVSEIFPPLHGGSGRWFWELYTRLPKENCFFAVGNAKNAAIFDSTHDLDLKRFDLTSVDWGIKGKQGCKFYWRMYWSLRSYIKKNRIEQLHCGRCIPEGFLGYLLSKSLRIPLLCFVHGEDIEAAFTSREFTWIVKRVLHHSRLIICNSNNTAKLLKAKLPEVKSKVTVIHPGVDSSKFIPKERCMNDRNRLDWGNRTTILTVGRLQKRKGQDMLIKALPIIRERIPDILYAIVGGGEEQANLTEIMAKLGMQDHVMFMNEVDEETALKCYQQCDLFALPNRTYQQDIEGFGIVLVEAQSCGKAVLAGDSGGTKETMRVGETGIITDCTNKENLAREILSLLSDRDRLAKMGIQGRKHVMHELDWTVLVDQTQKAMFSLDTEKSEERNG